MRSPMMGGLGSSSLMSLSMMNRLRGRSSSSSDELLLGLGVMIPHVPLKFELIDWQVLESCLNRMEFLVDTQNCYRDPLVTDLGSCTNNGCIYHEGNCFYCKEAYENQNRNQVFSLATASRSATLESCEVA